MTSKTIETEIRAEILSENYELIKNNISQRWELHSHTKRLSVMFFGEIEKQQVDVRVRVTNGQCEVVTKTGSFWAADRKEQSQNILPEQFMGIVRMFAQIFSNIKVGERETANYILEDKITASLVTAKQLVYLELEKMSNSDTAENDLNVLESLAKDLELKILKGEKDLDDFCRRLETEGADWRFGGSEEDYQKLEKAYSFYI